MEDLLLETANIKKQIPHLQPPAAHTVGMHAAPQTVHPPLEPASAVELAAAGVAAAVAAGHAPSGRRTSCASCGDDAFSCFSGAPTAARSVTRLAADIGDAQR